MAFENPILDQSYDTGSTNFLQYRVVRLTTSNTVVHTTAVSTGASAAIALGVTQTAPTASTSSTGTAVAVRHIGITKIEASSRAVSVGNRVRATSGAVASTSRLGGTVRPTTAAARPGLGIALTSAGAGTGKRLITVLLTLPSNG